MIDLSSAKFSDTDKNALIEACRYQPYKFAGDIYTGSGLSMVKSTMLRYISASDPDPDRDQFIVESKRQSDMYETFVRYVNDRVPVFGKTFLDVASNSGYFCYRMSQLGASRSVGMDVGDYAGTYSKVNAALRTNAKFVKGAYDMHTHTLDVDGEFDIVFNTAFMCHSSDPTFLLESLAKKAKKALLIFSKFSRDDEYVIRYSKTTSRYFMQKFPICFDATTEISDSLLTFGLKELGFSDVTEVPRNEYWLPRSAPWRAFLAIR